MKELTVKNKPNEVQQFIDEPHNFITPKRRSEWSKTGVTFDMCIAYINQPDQFEHTASQIATLSEGVQKVLCMLVSIEELDVLERFDAMGYPIELHNLVKNSKYSHNNNVLKKCELPAELQPHVDIESFRMPALYCRASGRPEGDLGDALTRQINAARAAIDKHDERCMDRAKAYMFGRTPVTPKQRVLSNLMDTFHELNWERDMLPYLDLKERKNSDHDQ